VDSILFIFHKLKNAKPELLILKQLKMKRRNFVKTSGLAITGGITIPAIIPSTVFGKNAPSNRINVGMMSFGRQAQGNTRSFLNFEDVVVTSVCDVDAWRMERGKEMIESHYAKNSIGGKYKGCKTYKDFRDMIADESIDAVMISSPDHWHVPMSLLAVEAGKDVCCEKPLTLSIKEGRILADAVKKHQRVFRTDVRLSAALIGNNQGFLTLVFHSLLILPDKFPGL